MRIDEIEIPKKLYHAVKTAHPSSNMNKGLFPCEKIQQFDAMLKKQGWKKIGEGNFSIVYANDKKNYVLKVNTQSDPAYDMFVKFCQKQHSVYLPKIIDKKFFIKPNTRFIGPERNTYYLYFIERLQKAPENVKVIIKKCALAMEFADNFPEEYYKKRLEKYPGLYDIIKKIVLKSRRNTGTLGLDLHSGNIMMRKDGTPVIIDPYA